MKACTKCGIVKPLSDFHNCRDSSDGKRYACKECLIAQVKRYAKSPEGQVKIRKKTREYYSKNRENIIEQSKEWRKKNLDKHKKNNVAYSRSPRGRARQLWLKARRRHKGSSDTFVSFDRILDAIEKGVCERTGIRFEFEPHPVHKRQMFGPSIDKIKPEGDYTEDNICVVCNMYNFGKNQFTHEEFLDFCRMFVAHADGASNP